MQIGYKNISICNYHADTWSGGELQKNLKIYRQFDLRYIVSFYRAMLRRARHCYGKYSLSVRTSVRDVEVPWSHRLEIFENNFTVK